MIWSKIPAFRWLFPAPDAGSVAAARAAAGAVAARWWKARVREPELAADLIRLGGVLVVQGAGAEPLDPGRLSYDAGRRDLALALLAMMSLEVSELNSLLEDNDVARLEH